MLVLCVKCKIEKPATDFRRCAAKKNGLASYCRSCANADHTVWVRGHAALISQRRKTYMRRYKEKYPEKYPPTVHQRLAACESLLREIAEVIAFPAMMATPVLTFDGWLDRIAAMLEVEE